MASEVREAIERARAAWDKAGRPGATPQLALFDEHRYGVAEHVRGERADRPRRRRRRR